jgi:hypothetical protein
MVLRPRGVPSLWLLILLTLLGCEGQLASDEELIDFFDKNRTSVERLFEIAQQDKLELMDLAQVPPLIGRADDVGTDDLPIDRIMEYEELFEGIGVRFLFNMSDSDGVFIWTTTTETGWPTCRKQIGYLYSSTDPTRVFRSYPVVEDLSGRMRSEGAAFRRIEGNWYLFFEPCID